MKKTSVLITGVAGLFGSNFSRYLLDNDYSVIGVDDLSGGYLDNLDKRFVISDCHTAQKKQQAVFVNLNLLDHGALNHLFEIYKPDYVYHFAAYAAVGLSPFIRNFNYENNLICSANINNACVNNDVKKIIFTSSMDVYGSKNNLPYVEDMIPAPEDPYGIAKLAVEHDLASAHRFFGLDYSIVRPHNVIGKYQNIWDKYRNVIGIWIRQAIANQPLTIYGDGTQKRAFSDISFYMKPLEFLMKHHNSEIFNIGADKEFTINEVCDLVIEVAKEFGISASKVHLEKRNEVYAAYCDHTKAKKLLNFSDQTDIRKTVKEMFEWAILQPNRKIKVMDYEIHKNMYSFWK